jgi:hypothetical protein
MKSMLRGALTVLCAVAVFVVGLCAPANAALPPVPSGAAYIQRTMFLGQYGGFAQIYPDTGRSIYLAKHRYLWTNTWYDRNDTSRYDESRVLDLAAGTYVWQCFVTTYTEAANEYDTKCSLVSGRDIYDLDIFESTVTPNSPYFQTCKCESYNKVLGEWFTWRSQLAIVS